MSENTKIEWCDHTINFWWGCEKVHAGCKNCYAEAWSKRWGRKLWGPGSVRLKMENAIATAHKLDRKANKLGVRYRVFANSMADMFEIFEGEVVDKDGVLIGYGLNTLRREAFQCMRETENLTWLVLTKRPENVRENLGGPFRRRFENLWLGTSPCNQETADNSIPELLKVRDLCGGLFLSCEPLLGAMDLRGFMMTGNRIDWVIVGGESGRKARPMNPDWVRGIRDQCQAAGVPFFFKQYGEYGTRSFNLATGEPVFRQFRDFGHWVAKAPTWIDGGTCIDTCGRVLVRGTDFMRARDENTFPVTILHRLGKHAAGRLLDGREWSEFPESFTTSEVGNH